MSFILTQVALQRVIQVGLAGLKTDRAAFDDIFAMYNHSNMVNDYGPAYIDTIWAWFTETRIPVVQAWALNKTRIPGISIHLNTESEDESKAAIGDFYGIDVEEDQAIGTGVFTVNLDIGIHADKTGDEVLWLYYIVSYVLFNQKRLAEDMGLMLHTFSGSDYGKRMDWMPENIWSRWIKYRATVQNMWSAGELFEADSVVADIDAQSAAESGDDDLVRTATSITK